MAVARPAQVTVHEPRQSRQVGEVDPLFRCGRVGEVGFPEREWVVPVYVQPRRPAVGQAHVFDPLLGGDVPGREGHPPDHEVGAADALQGAVGRVEDAGVQMWRAPLGRVQAGEARRGRQRLEVARARGLPPDHPQVHRRVAPGGGDREVGVVPGVLGRPVPRFAAVGPFRRADDLQGYLDVVSRGFAHRASDLRGPDVGLVVGVEEVAGAAHSGRIPVQVVLVDPHAEVAVGGEQRDPVVDRGAPHRLQGRTVRSPRRRRDSGPGEPQRPQRDDGRYDRQSLGEAPGTDAEQVGARGRHRGAHELSLCSHAARV